MKPKSGDRILFEVQRIKNSYCKNCINFDVDNNKCVLDKIYKVCFEKHQKTSRSL